MERGSKVKFNAETQVEGFKVVFWFFIIELRTPKIIDNLRLMNESYLYNVDVAGVLQPLSGKVKIMMNRSIVDGSPRLLFEYQAILPISYFSPKILHTNDSFILF